MEKYTKKELLMYAQGVLDSQDKEYNFIQQYGVTIEVDDRYRLLISYNTSKGWRDTMKYDILVYNEKHSILQNIMKSVTFIIGSAKPSWKDGGNVFKVAYDAVADAYNNLDLYYKEDLEPQEIRYAKELIELSTIMGQEHLDELNKL